ncbi:hypothetical protein [Thiomicrorhabdus sp.]|uniref:hypothetical protein n=1 Tax=Thiomicrorhabdus sp. TaxID=2039724 RepID=UPI0029C7E090|nr:hypothetical protein [Thiomicrorhabdus sp.]
MVLALGAVLSVVASLMMFSNSSRWILAAQQSQQELRIHALSDAKKRLLAFAVLQPERYLTDNSSNFQGAEQQPSPGYFPCVDLNGDGLLTGGETRCGRIFSGVADSGFAPDPSRSGCLAHPCVGFLPGRIVTRHYYFSSDARFYYFVDERFVHSNPNYVNGQLYRFAPLSPSSLDPSNAGRLPILSVNGISGYVAVLIDAGSDGLNDENRDGDYLFKQGDEAEGALRDLVVGIHWEELSQWIQARICAEKERFNAALPLASEEGMHWFKAYDVIDNPLGANGREWVCP